MHQRKKRIIDRLRQHSFEVADSYANFFFLNTGKNSVQVAKELLKVGIIVKPWTAEGYDRFLRVTVGTEEENDLFFTHLLEAVK